jgi:hypothetical protein
MNLGRWPWSFVMLLLLRHGACPLSALPAIEDSSFGYRLPGSSKCAIWWCEGTYKVGRQRALPVATADGVWIEAARNEYEPFQLVLYPAEILSNVVIRAENWAHSNTPGVVFASTNIEIRQVEYVPVDQPSDAGGSTGWYPDPLPPVPTGLCLEPERQQPFWITIHVPKTQPAGEYGGQILIEAEGWTEPLAVPVRLRVFDFTLSDVTHTRTLYDVAVPRRWHGPLTDAQFAQVWDLYLENFRRHRVSPEWPQLYAPIRWQPGASGYVYDFRNFDLALGRYLDEFGFNAFVFMDEPWTLSGYPRFSPEFNALFTQLMSGIAEHLRAKGWMDRACAYWIDEPNNSLLPFVQEGMRAHLYAAPDLKRLVTREPVPELYGLVDIWVPIAVISVYLFTSDRWFDRMAAGEEVWWYVAMYPKWPVPNYFVDHPAISHRIRFWLGERYGISGDLYWDVAWYFDWSYQPINPWTQVTVTNQYGPTGNGDGRLVYPPVREPPVNPVVAGPIDSIRWELVREGLEDREYFWLLRELGRRCALRWGPDHPAVLAAEMVRTQALAVAPALTNALGDPRQVYQARRALASAIENLSTGEPFWVEEPVSRAVEAGESFVLRCEALGWPPPVYYWFRDGTPISVTTDTRLRIAAAGPETVGDYVVVASNIWGRVTSRVARVRGVWAEAPEIVTPPRAQTVRLGNPTVLTVVAVGQKPLEYVWLKDGQPVLSDGPPGPTFLRSNTPPEAMGLYQVAVINAFGAVTSAPVRVAVSWDWLSSTILPTNANWWYDNRGVPLAEGWWTNTATNMDWQIGAAPFGAGFTGVATSLTSDGASLPPTTYFLTDLVLGPRTFPLKCRLHCDDGAVVYLNGHEVFRFNLPAGPVEYGRSALASIAGSPAEAFFDLPAQWLQEGTNRLAVELHQCTEPVGPLEVWPLDETGPTWEGLEGRFALRAVGPGVVSAVGLRGGCVSNAASPTSWLELSESPGLQVGQPFTFGGWFQWQYGSSHIAASIAIEKAGEYRLYYTGPLTNRYRFQFGSVEVQEQTAGTMAGQWRLVIAWYDGTNACIQMDNGPVYSMPASPPQATTNPVVVLRLTPGAGAFAADELFLFPRALSAAERTAIYQSGIRQFVTNLLESAVADAWFDLEVVRWIGCPPQFTNGPESLVRFEGESAGFELKTVGTAPVGYQWLCNGIPIPGATDNLLFLTQLTEGHSGDYALVASNVAGAVTSSPARLQVFAKPRVDASLEADRSGLRFHLPAMPLPSTLQASTNLIDWEPVWTSPANSPAMEWVLPIQPDRPAQFFRLQLLR